MTLDEIDAICKAATPGSWRNESYDHGWIEYGNVALCPLCLTDMMSDHDAAFIAMARTALPKLLEVASWAQIALEQYGYMSDYQDPMHQLAVALREFEEKKDGT